MTPFTIEETNDPRGLVIRVSGFMDLAGAEKFEKHLAAVMVRKPSIVVFELAGASYISSPCIGALVMFRQGITRHGGEVRLAATHPTIADTFHRVGLHQVFPMFDTTEAALATVK